MRKLPHPTLSVAEALAACIPHIADPDKALRLKEIGAALTSAETAYKVQGTAHSLYKIEPSDNVTNLVSLDEMGKLYDGTFSREKTTSRHIYDKLKLGSLMCPLCGAQQVKTLDHYLAKTKHPQYAITPLNLIPACSDCNKAKSNFQPVSANDQAIHPYFDDIDDERWLFALVQTTTPPALVFFVSPSASWDLIKADRVRKGFEILQLSTLFAALSSDEVTNMKHRLKRLHKAAGATGVSAHLFEARDDLLEERKNSWQIAMYDALASSQWYCDGGFA